ncbi:hypothetical protein [Methylobacterium sp. Leaf85]|uniref:hypothetical protein n=1 Tax=Methylobacterium sp. Leaf85 TaxID=1736241 RepID=UPI00138EF68E|nr:hypothetical protein [Methylobacterium sp. Leaf85]
MTDWTCAFSADGAIRWYYAACCGVFNAVLEHDGSFSVLPAASSAERAVKRSALDVITHQGLDFWQPRLPPAFLDCSFALAINQQRVLTLATKFSRQDHLMTLAEALQRFNRKERHWLVRDALGETSRRLDCNFLKRVEAAVRCRDSTFSADPAAWWAIDFHIDWLVAALHAHCSPDAATARQSNGDRRVTGSQQDIDLVVVSGTTLILIEAKGVGSWRGAGLDQKIGRLAALTPSVFGADGLLGDVRTHFLLCSPGPAPSLDVTPWPSWTLVDGRPLHIPMKVSAEGGPLLRVERCNDKNRSDAGGEFWHAVEDRPGNKLVRNVDLRPILKPVS